MYFVSNNWIDGTLRCHRFLSYQMWCCLLESTSIIAQWNWTFKSMVGWHARFLRTFGHLKSIAVLHRLLLPHHVNFIRRSQALLISQKGMLETLRRGRTFLRINLQHKFKEILKQKMHLTPSIFDKLVQSVKIFHIMSCWRSCGSGGPSKSHLFSLYVQFFFLISIFVQLRRNCFISALLGHLKRNGAALFLNHGQMFQIVFIWRVKEELARVKLNQNASHWPDVTFFVPRSIFEDNLRRAILSRINYQRMAFIFVGGPSKINQSYICVQWSLPHSLWSIWLRSLWLWTYRLLGIVLVVQERSWGLDWKLERGNGRGANVCEWRPSCLRRHLYWIQIVVAVCGGRLLYEERIWVEKILVGCCYGQLSQLWSL